MVRKAKRSPKDGGLAARRTDEILRHAIVHFARRIIRFHMRVLLAEEIFPNRVKYPSHIGVCYFWMNSPNSEPACSK